MANITEAALTAFIEQNIQGFHQKRLKSLNGLKLRKVLERKNPYLFKAKSITTAADLVKGVLDAHLSSQEEGIFGGFLEELAIFVCKNAYGGRKSSAEGIDLEFERDGALYIVSIKSGPNWGNSRQAKKLSDDFRKAKRVLGTNATARKVIAVNGCCYGREFRDCGDYVKLCGQKFWTLVSGSSSLYTDIIEPLGHKAKERNEAFQDQYGSAINRFTKEFIDEFCDVAGNILWEKMVRMNSRESEKRTQKERTRTTQA